MNSLLILFRESCVLRSPSKRENTRALSLCEYLCSPQHRVLDPRPSTILFILFFNQYIIKFIYIKYNQLMPPWFSYSFAKGITPPPPSSRHSSSNNLFLLDFIFLFIWFPLCLISYFAVRWSLEFQKHRECAPSTTKRKKLLPRRPRF